MTKNVLNKLGFLGAVFAAAVGFPLIFASSASAQLPAPAGPAEPGTPASEVERVIVTGSNIPTAEETGPNPVDTYRPQDIENWVSATQPTCKHSSRRRRVEPLTRTLPTAAMVASSSTCAVSWRRRLWF